MQFRDSAETSRSHTSRVDTVILKAASFSRWNEDPCKEHIYTFNICLNDGMLAMTDIHD